MVVVSVDVVLDEAAVLPPEDVVVEEDGSDVDADEVAVGSIATSRSDA